MANDLDQNQQISYSELQKKYDLLTDEISFLRKSERIDDLSPRERFRLTKQIEEVEKERTQVSQQLQELEKTALSIGANIHQNLYPTLLKLGYRLQIRAFRKLMETDSIHAFLIHGFPDYGQRWLLNRLVVQYVPHVLTGKVVVINVSRKVRRNDASAFWREIAGRVGLQGQQSTPTEIAEKVYRWWQTQNVLFVFHDVEKMPENTLSELIQNFWSPLINKIQELQSPPSKFKLIMFLIDYEGCVENWQIPLAEEINSHWTPQTPFRAPKIAEFSANELTDWIETEFDKLPTILTNQVDSTVQAILADSQNGIPEVVLENICQLCGCDWYEESEKWLKL